MDDLIAFLKARLDEDEAQLKESEDYRGPGCALPGLHLDPPRARRELAAVRAIVERYERGAAGDLPEWKPGRELIEAGLAVLAGALRDLAAVYAGHPDYRPEWKP